MSLLIATSPTLTSSSGTVSRIKASGTPTTPVAANVAMTAPATTVIGADAEIPSTDRPGEPRLLRARPCGEDGRVTTRNPWSLAPRTARNGVVDGALAARAASTPAGRWPLRRG